MEQTYEMLRGFAMVDDLVNNMSAAIKEVVLATLYSELVGQDKTFKSHYDVVAMVASLKAVRNTVNNELAAKAKEGESDA